MFQEENNDVVDISFPNKRFECALAKDFCFDFAHKFIGRSDCHFNAPNFNELVITGILFPHKNMHKATWVSPDGITRNQIDHVLINTIQEFSKRH